LTSHQNGLGVEKPRGGEEECVSQSLARQLEEFIIAMLLQMSFSFYGCC
jgi:hypothetical protein